MLIWIFVFVLGFWTLFTIINVWTLPSLATFSVPKRPGVISVLVPLRNEERNLPALVRSLRQADDLKTEFIFLDDHSTDRTRMLLQEAVRHWPNARYIDGAALPEGWNGKVHACHQLSQEASGQYLCFIDADVRLHADALRWAEGALQKHHAGLVTGFPQFETEGFWGRLLVYMQHVVVYAHLPVAAANRTTWRSFTAAHGAFLFFSREAYDQAGGHAAVKNALVDDMALAQNVKSSGLKTLLVSPGHVVTCYMYTSSREAWLGFSKNIFPGIGRSMPIASAVIAVHTLFFIMPALLLLAAISMLDWQLAIPYVLTAALRAAITIKASHPWWTVLIQPLSSGAMIAVLLYSIYLDKTKKGYSWKGRTYQ
ncbi:hypothetical protein CHL76_06130 [Marinococcus halophilus]|uniref:Glycosyl hydrolase n=1 Tax=Marinococcus halophilus TaxID=1371 RepID=A0A510Y3Q0_MARHA|nr:glycosyltransferase family 2 protein [Marinococcus halophilus]OZT80904.1 hypothetical protein CHL76_06130 [Marinococcus halophilus]GEK57962.1 glycosyl hydrolase [Marinococcus halophilus]